MSLSQGHDTIACYIIKIQLGSDNLLPGHGFWYVCTVTMASETWPWVKVMAHPWVMDNNCVKYYLDPTWQWGVLARTQIWVCLQCDLDLGDMTLGQSHDTPLGQGQQLCEILSRSNLAVRSYGPDTDFHYVCTVTLTLGIWPWVKVMTNPRVMDNNCVKLYPDRTRGYEVMARARCEQTDRQTGWILYTPQTLFCGGILITKI